MFNFGVLLSYDLLVLFLRLTDIIFKTIIVYNRSYRPLTI